MPRLFFWLIILIVFVVGTPYVATVQNAQMGSWSATGIEHDGSVTHMVFGRDLPRPSWLPVPPDATIVQVSYLTNSRQARNNGLLEVSTRQPLAALRQFYRARLQAAGFEVTDLGTGTLNAKAAAFLGIANSFVATRQKSGDQLNGTIMTPEGIFRTTLVQMSWRKSR